jgi:CheY-like chemotaxis protein
MKKEENIVVMLIDDNKIDNFVTLKILEKAWHGSRFIVVSTAKEALKMLDSSMEELESIPDIIFLDINMPALNGFDFLSRYEKLPDYITKKCKIVVLTSSEKDEDMSDMMKNKFVIQYLSKPLTNEALSQVRKKSGIRQ